MDPFAFLAAIVSALSVGLLLGVTVGHWTAIKDQDNRKDNK